jgi:hypothetical protein
LTFLKSHIVCERLWQAKGGKHTLTIWKRKPPASSFCSKALPQYASDALTGSAHTEGVFCFFHAALGKSAATKLISSGLMM